MKAVTKDASGFVYSAGVEPPPPARFLTYAPEGWRSSDGQAGGAVSIDQDFFTPTPRASLATRRSQSALSPYASRHARNPVPPPVPDIHDFHRDPFDPASPSAPIPSAFQLEQEPTRRSKTRPTTAVDNEEASLDRLPRNYNVVDDLTTDAQPPPSMLFRSVSRPLAFNPSATRTIGRPLKAKTLSSTREFKVKEESAVAPALTAASVLALGPEMAWAQYLQMTPAGYPPDLLAALFDSQAALDLGSATRRDRLVNVALRATAFVSEDDLPLTLAQFKRAFVLGLEAGEDADVAFEDEDTVRVAKAAKQETAAILLREVWRAITDLKERGAQPEVLSWDESVGLFWRWVGLVAWTGPASADEPSLFPYARPNAQTDRIDDLALFLDKIASTTESGLSDFTQSVARGWVNQDLVADLEQARQQVIDIRAERDQILVQDKTLDMREAREKLWTFLRSAYYGRGASDDKAVEGWVETLLVAQRNPPESAITTFEEAASLRSRWTTTLLIARNIARSERAIPASCLWYLCDGLERLNGTAEHRLSLDHLRSLASTLLESSPDLSCISSRQHYDLLLEFIRLEDLPFAKRFYQTFRLRERQFAFSQEVTHSLLRLAIQFDSPAAQDSDALKRPVSFVSSVYDDCVAWGSPALKGELLAEFLAVVAPDPGHGGVATRVLSDSIFAYGHEVLTDDIAFAIAQAARERVVSALTSAGDRTKAVSASDCTVSVASSFSVLPLLRGCYKHLSRQPPVSVFNDLLAFAAEHPTAENLEASVAEFTTMVNHGPAPDTETFNILIRMHLGVRRGPSSLTEMFARIEPCEPHVNMVRAITLFKTMVVRQKLQPNRDTFSHFVHGLVEVGQPLAAFECFRHAVNLGLFPSRESTSELVRALVADGHQAEVETVATALESLFPHRAEHGRLSSISSPATLDEVGMKTLSDTVLSTILPTRRPPSSEVRPCPR